MKRNFFGIFRAIVTDTECFRETGMIKTRISILNDGYIAKSLTDRYDSSSFEEGLKKDLLTKIFMPFGGGYNYGMFKLPPVNSYGLVAFVDGDSEEPVWLGGISTADYTPTGVLYKSNIPSDDLFSDKSAITFDEGKNGAEFNTKDINSFVIKTKNNTLESLSNESTMIWENRKVENGIVMNEEKMDFVHFGENSAQRIILAEGDSKKKEYSISISDLRGSGDSSSISVGDPGIKIEITDGASSTSRINLSETGITIRFKNGDKETTIAQNENTIILEKGDSYITMKNNGVLEEIELKAPKVAISSDKIIMGSTDYKVVVAPNDFNLTLEDGTMLSTAKNVRV